MAAKKSTSSTTKILTPKKKRSGVHAKSGSSKIKTSKLYKKRSVGQG